MKNYQHTLEFITPAFPAGADQTKAEIRVPEFRGLLRFWWSVLYPSADCGPVLGTTDGDSRRSAVTVRIIEEKIISDENDLPSMRMGTPLAYLAYFANASGKERGQNFGPRFSQGGFFSPGTRFQLLVKIKDRGLPAGYIEKFERVLKYALTFGSIGYRSRRGFGAFVDIDNPPEYDDVTAMLDELDNVEPFWITDEEEGAVFSNDWQGVLQYQEAYLKELRGQEPKVHFSASKQESFIGFSGNPRKRIDRQASALFLRPVLLADGDILPLIFLYQDRLHTLVSKADSDDLSLEFKYEGKAYQVN